jgi:hypothetical protein
VLPSWDIGLFHICLLPFSTSALLQEAPLPDITFNKTMHVNGSPDVSFKAPEHKGQSTFKNAPLPAGHSTPQMRDGTVYISRVSDNGRHKSQSPADGIGLVRETPVIEVIH